jgi:hypothetical protein
MSSTLRLNTPKRVEMVANGRALVQKGGAALAAAGFGQTQSEITYRMSAATRSPDQPNAPVRYLI